uniref:Uncharacterized protein n=1 Tax=Anguilla anguilla TaxID=7936 RepID=A0A0E9QJM3_ANGAN
MEKSGCPVLQMVMSLSTTGLWDTSHWMEVWPTWKMRRHCHSEEERARRHHLFCQESCQPQLYNGSTVCLPSSNLHFGKWDGGYSQCENW